MKFNIIAGWLGGYEILLVLVIVLIFFGGKKIPELMRGLGKGVKEFKDATKEEFKNQSQDQAKKNGEPVE